MTSRPAPGVHDAQQHRGGASAYAPARRAASHHPHGQDPSPEHDRVADQRLPKAKPKGKPIQLDGLQTMAYDPVRAPPKGKPQLFFSATAQNCLESEPSPTAAPLPVPPRPSLSVPTGALQQRSVVPGGTGVKDNAPSARLVSQDTVPAAAVLPGGRTVDLFPWTGSHPEDVLSEALVKGGISNKSQIMNETNTARLSLWANLKNKSGTSTLSTLFVAVLEKRQSCNRLAAPNTFKPPPRLTLRDSTRETWLHDLANPAVGLRRLSRTIPHGITGKLLLEQCLNKSIPIPRALWLAKCVGINEMRAHKRKGQAGTITWVRGWTSSVEQFLDGVIASVGQQDWKVRITYALQLVAHLFKERLVEEDHFIDWVLKSLDSCSSERLYLWLLIICIPDFSCNLTISRRRAKRLAESLLAHAEKLYNVEGRMRETPVLSLLEHTIARVTMTRPASFLFPLDWKSRREVLHIFSQRQSHRKVSLVLSELDRRNQSLMQPSKRESSALQTSLTTLYRLLDGVDYEATVCVDDLAFDCMGLIPDHACLIPAVLQWASSLYRQGLHRVYLVTRLLRKWNQVGVDVGEVIMKYLPCMSLECGKEAELVFKIIAELVRSRTFSLGRYLQWLIATGSLNQIQGIRMDPTWQLRLLTQVPLTGLSEQVFNLRSTMLRRTSYSTEQEARLILNTKESIQQHLADHDPVQSPVNTVTTTSIENLSQAVRLEAATWLRHHVVSTMLVTDSAINKPDDVFKTTSVCTMSRRQFVTVRYYLEQFGDIAILADVVGIAATSYDPHILSPAVDTLCSHVKAFKAMGAFNSLLEKIVTRYTGIRTIRLPDRDLILSMNALSQLVHIDSRITSLLDYDLGRYYQKPSFAASSPVSDTMIENITRSDLEDEMERILSSGDRMDQQTMSRVFSKVVSYLEEQVYQGVHLTENISTWFYRLRNLEENNFHIILTSWLHSLLADDQRQLLSAALPLLVVSGCLTIGLFLEITHSCIRRLQPSHPAVSFNIAVKSLDMIIPIDQSGDLSQHQYSYRFRIQQSSFCQNPNSGLLGLVREVLELSILIPEKRCEEQLSRLLADDRLLSSLRNYAIIAPQSLSFLLEYVQRPSNSSTHALVESLLNRIVDPLDSLELPQKSYEQQATTIFRYADQLSLPFWRLKLRSLFISSSATGRSVDDIPLFFVSFLKSHSELDHSYLLDVICGLDEKLLSLIQKQAENEILTHSAFLCDGKLDDNNDCLDAPHFVHRFLDVIHVGRIDNTREAPASLVALLIERFRGIVEILNQLQHRSTGCTEPMPKNNGVLTSDICSWLIVLLRVAVIQCPGLVLKANYQQQAALMWNLCILFNHRHLEASPQTTQYVFDVAVLLSDYVSDDVCKYLARLTYARCSTDTRCEFIFGTDTERDGWLGVARSASHAQVLHTVPSPQGHSQTPNAAQTQKESQQPFNAGAMLSQRPSIQQQYQQQQQQFQTHGQGRNSPYSQHAQAHKAPSPQLQRMGSELQQTQQMQAMAQKRQGYTLGGQPSVTSANPSHSSTDGKSVNAKSEKNDSKPVAYRLNRWEMLPENGGSTGGNETAIDLNMFGARKA